MSSWSPHKQRDLHKVARLVKAGVRTRLQFPSQITRSFKLLFKACGFSYTPQGTIILLFCFFVCFVSGFVLFSPIGVTLYPQNIFFHRATTNLNASGQRELNEAEHPGASNISKNCPAWNKRLSEGYTLRSQSNNILSRDGTERSELVGGGPHVLLVLMKQELQLGTRPSEPLSIIYSSKYLQFS